jgi:integrase
MLLIDGLIPWNPKKEGDQPEGKETPYVFPGESVRPVQPDTYYTTIRKLSKKQGVAISVHQLRHTFVSISGRGMDLKSLQSVLGHASSTLTLDLYRHLIDGDMQRAADVVDRSAAKIGLSPRQSAPISAPITK